MTYYIIVTGEGGELCNGVSEHEIERVAQSAADRLAETVYYSPVDTDHYANVAYRLKDLYDLNDAPAGSDAVAYVAVTVHGDDDEDAAADLAAIREALGDEYEADWTGNGNGDEMDIGIYVVETSDEDIGTAVEPRTVRCECGQCTGERCQWIGSPAETVVVEYMPEEHRASHEAAGNRGVYPHNGAIRVRCERSCAESIVESDDWAKIVSG